jgi:hypothetical protein
MKHEIIEQVWKAKGAIAARNAHDVRYLLKHLRSEERASGTRVVDLRKRQRTERQR